jgi:hypothetical protein
LSFSQLYQLSILFKQHGAGVSNIGNCVFTFMYQSKQQCGTRINTLLLSKLEKVIVERLTNYRTVTLILF